MVTPWMRRLRSAGVVHIGLAPGSRSTPLVIAAAEVYGASNVFVHFDERGLGFWALGIGKSTGQPAAVIVTSGTAVANLLPAVVEAYYSGIPLLVLSADRPFELIDVGANQAIRQSDIFHDWTVFTSDLHPPSDPLTERAWLSVIDRAASVWGTGPVHLNMRFREPLWAGGGGGQPPVFDGEAGLGRPTPKASVAPPPCLPVTHRLGRVLVVIGAANPNDSRAWIDGLVQIGGSALLDGISGSYWRSNGISLASEWVHSNCLSGVDTVVHLGGKLLSKPLNTALSNWTGRVIHWTTDARWQDPHHRVSDWVIGPVHWGWVDWVDAWVSFDGIQPILRGHLQAQTDWSELTAVSLIQQQLPEHWTCLIGNSMPIRLWAMTRVMSVVDRVAYTNRGASGIDGLIGTAAGIGVGCSRPVLALLGDLSALHDASSLAIWAKLPHAILVILNNSGGGIFNHLPVQAYSAVGPLFRADHSISFAGMAQSFGCLYACSGDLESAATALKKAIDQPGPWILEWQVESDATRRAIQVVKACLAKEI